jgi:hypothetical protein
VRWFLRALLLTAALVVTLQARAETALIHVEGVASKRFERDVGEALPEGIESKPSRAATAAVKQALRKHPLSKISGTPVADDPLVTSLRKAVRTSKHDLAVAIAVGKKRDVRVLVVRESDDSPIFFRETALPRFQSADEHVAWWADLFQEAMKATSKPEPEPPPEPPVEEKPPEKPKEKPKPPPPEEEKLDRPNYFFSLGADTSWRLFSDNESGNGPSRTYRAFPIFGFHAGMELYPIADGHIGFEGGYGMSIGTQSKSSDGQTLPTAWIRAEGAFKARVFTAHRNRSPWLAVLLGYGYSRFAFDNAPTNREIPTGVYQMLRAGLDGRAPIDRIVLSAGAEYDHLVSIDSLGTLPAGSSGNGVTARASVGFEVASDFFLRLEGRYTWLRFGLVRDVPSYAVDQYLSGSVSGELAF